MKEFELEQIMLHPMVNPPCNRESLNSTSSMIVSYDCLLSRFCPWFWVFYKNDIGWIFQFQSWKRNTKIIESPEKVIRHSSNHPMDRILLAHEVCCLHRLSPLRWDHHGALLCSVSRWLVAQFFVQKPLVFGAFFPWEMWKKMIPWNLWEVFCQQTKIRFGLWKLD